MSAISFSEFCSMAACSHICIHSSFTFPCITSAPIWQALDGDCEAHGLLQALGQVWRVSVSGTITGVCGSAFRQVRKRSRADEKIFPFTGQNRRTAIRVEAQRIARAKKS